MNWGRATARGPSRRTTAVALVAFGLLLAGAPAAMGAPPALTAPWASDVSASTAKLHGTVDPQGDPTTFRFDVISQAGYEANVSAGKDGFFGSTRVPKVEGTVGSGTGAVAVSGVAGGLGAATRYRYRLRALNSEGIFVTDAAIFTTQPLGGGEVPADGRRWEMVSPVDKNGGQVDLPEAIMGGGVLQAAAQGSAVTYGSAASFAGGTGAPPASQYLAARTAGGWTTENLSVPLFAGSFSLGSEGVPYRLFAPDLSRGLVLNGRHCRGDAASCPIDNPPLPGTGAPTGYQNYYLRETATAAFSSLLSAGDVAKTPLGPSAFDLNLAGASPDLRHVVLSSCVALTADAVEVPLGEGCDPAKQNLYAWSPGSGLTLVNILPAQVQGAPGASLAAQATAVSADGARVYWSSPANLYLREGATTFQVDAAAGGGGSFQVAAVDGSVAYFTKSGHLWRYSAGGAATDLTPGGGVIGVLGASVDGAAVYYVTGAGLFLRQGNETTEVADAADASNYPPTTGTARVSADGTRLAFVATPSLTGYDNTDVNTGLPDSQVYLYEADAGQLTCVSCNPTNARPRGPSTIPGATANGVGPSATQAYKPRVLAAEGKRVFFDSRDAIAATDTNNDSDVYQWEAAKTGSCTASGGCLSLISSGRAEGGAFFVDASSDGADAFFITDGSLVSRDAGSFDLYDARVGGGFPEAERGISCDGNACQGLLTEPTDPALNTQLPGLGNPKVRYLGGGKACKKGFEKRKGHCVKKRKGKKQRGGRR